LRAFRNAGQPAFPKNSNKKRNGVKETGKGVEIKNIAKL